MLFNSFDLISSIFCCDASSCLNSIPVKIIGDNSIKNSAIFVTPSFFEKQGTFVLDLRGYPNKHNLINDVVQEINKYDKTSFKVDVKNRELDLVMFVEDVSFNGVDEFNRISVTFTITINIHKIKDLKEE